MIVGSAENWNITGMPARIVENAITPSVFSSRCHASRQLAAGIDSKPAEHTTASKVEPDLTTKIEAARIALGGRRQYGDHLRPHPRPPGAARGGGARDMVSHPGKPPPGAQALDRRHARAGRPPHRRRRRRAGAARRQEPAARGVVALDGSFGRGDPVSIVARSGQEFARGLVAYDRPEADRIIGRNQGHRGLARL